MQVWSTYLPCVLRRLIDLPPCASRLTPENSPCVSRYPRTCRYYGNLGMEGENLMEQVDSAKEQRIVDEGEEEGKEQAASTHQACLACSTDFSVNDVLQCLYRGYRSVCFSRLQLTSCTPGSSSDITNHL